MESIYYKMAELVLVQSEPVSLSFADEVTHLCHILPRDTPPLVRVQKPMKS